MILYTYSVSLRVATTSETIEVFFDVCNVFPNVHFNDNESKLQLKYHFCISLLQVEFH